MGTDQLDLFNEARVEVEKPELKTEVRLGRRSAQISLRRQRRTAIARLLEILTALEGKDIYVGSYEAGGRHFWMDNLKLQRLQLTYHPIRLKSEAEWLPSVIVLWGTRGGHVRIFTDYLVAVREQDYQGYWHYFLDFHNGFWESTIDKYRSHYACLTLTRFKD